jgi:hypothetical protein
MVEQRPAPKRDAGAALCGHYACRCARATELAAMYDRTGRGSLLREAVEVHEKQVRCRQEVA